MMKINNPKWYHLKHNTLFTQINNGTYIGKVGISSGLYQCWTRH